MRKKLLLTVLLSGSLFLANADNISIIPQPVSIIQNDGYFRLTEKITIGYEPECKAQAELLQNVLSQSTGWDIELSESLKNATIRLSVSSEKVIKPEGYNLEVTPAKVSICGADNAGVFYGIQTFLQLLPSEVYSDKRQRNIDWKAPSVSINDAPERPWRGMMLDVARYFYDKEFVKKYIDMMAMYKLNKLQFHMIDDSGWRLEIKKYPRLTEVGAWAGKNGHRLGGYYTQEDIKELIGILIFLKARHQVKSRLQDGCRLSRWKNVTLWKSTTIQPHPRCLVFRDVSGPISSYMARYFRSSAY